MEWCNHSWCSRHPKTCTASSPFWRWLRHRVLVRHLEASNPSRNLFKASWRLLEELKNWCHSNLPPFPMDPMPVALLWPAIYRSARWKSDCLNGCASSCWTQVRCHPIFAPSPSTFCTLGWTSWVCAVHQGFLWKWCTETYSNCHSPS